MCQQCVEAIKTYWPDLPRKDWGDLLWGATCFPFGCPKQTTDQIKEMAERSGRRLELALALADEDTEMAMRANP